jgi:O-antigen/teichoic acid export membrane protein
VGPERGAVVAVAALALFASAWATDVGPRSDGRLRWVALAQAVRALGALAAVFWLVGGPADARGAAWCVVIAEVSAAAVPLALHLREHGTPFPRLRGRETRVIAHRAAVAGLSRFVRVSLYGVDLLALGWWVGGDVGPYAAGRRVVYALAALGLVVPAVLGPSIAAAWMAGAEPARRRVAECLSALWSLSLPAAVGLAYTSGRWMPALFGADYQNGGPWLALVVARLPWMLGAAFSQTALVACRRERLGLRLVLWQAAVAAIGVPVGLALDGPWGVGWAVFVVEASGAIGGWVLLGSLGLAPRWAELAGRPLAGCLGLIAACRLAQQAPLALLVPAGALGYALAWRAASRWVRFDTLTAWAGR